MAWLGRVLAPLGTLPHVPHEVRNARPNPQEQEFDPLRTPLGQHKMGARVELDFFDGRFQSRRSDCSHGYSWGEANCP